MTSRELPFAEWSKLDGTEAGSVWRDLNPATTRVLAIEEDGELVATWLLMQVVHAECVWIKPSHRARLGVVRRLLSGMSRIAGELGARTVVTGSVTPEVTDFIRRIGGVPIPCASFVIPVKS